MVEPLENMNRYFWLEKYTKLTLISPYVRSLGAQTINSCVVFSSLVVRAVCLFFAKISRTQYWYTVLFDRKNSFFEHFYNKNFHLKISNSLVEILTKSDATVKINKSYHMVRIYSYLQTYNWTWQSVHNFHIFTNITDPGDIWWVLLPLMI